MIFVDTGAWFAATVPTDPDHPAASLWLAVNSEPLLTTDYIVDETLTLLRARGERRRAVLVGARLMNGDLADVYRLTEEDIARAWEIFRDFDDKDWITWLKDESLEDAEDLPEPQDLAAEAITELEAVVDDLREMLTLLEREEAAEEVAEAAA